MKLNAQELRTTPEEDAKQATLDNRTPLFLILENIYDTYNIGGLFRLADALNAETIYLCGQTEIPPNPRIKKASIGTYKIVPWKYTKTVEEALQEIKKKTDSLLTIAVEQDKRSVPYTSISYQTPLALIVGNETFGILPETLALADHIAEIPMWGINKSLNVIVSAAIVSYFAIQQLHSR